MNALKKCLSLFALAAVGGLALAACNGLGNAGLTGGIPGLTPPVGGQISQGRLNAARLITPGSSLTIDVLQQDLGNVMQLRCDPLGLNGGMAWDSRIGGAKTLIPTLLTSEYDVLFHDFETDYILGLRAPTEPNFPLSFTQVELNLRAVNPFFNGHVHNTHYGPTQANLPSNDDDPAARSLIDLMGGDVAVVVHGINFAGPGLSNSRAFMNGLGPLAWLTFLRDNAFQSGRFFAIAGAMKGAPGAFFDTPGPADDGFFQSAQVNGLKFDALSEPFGTMTPATIEVCSGAPNLGRPYAFLDRSNLADDGMTASPGEGGFAFIMRHEAFRPGGTIAGVVIDPSGPPMDIAPTDTMMAPNSGYNEPAIPGIVATGDPLHHNETDHSVVGSGPQGVHEMGISVFFVHR